VDKWPAPKAFGGLLCASATVGGLPDKAGDWIMDAMVVMAVVGRNRLLGFGGKTNCAGSNHLAQSLLRAPRMEIIAWLHADNVLGNQRLPLGVLFTRQSLTHALGNVLGDQ
jgi:hypothetical protein